MTGFTNSYFSPIHSTGGERATAKKYFLWYGLQEKRGQIYFPENRSIPFVHLTVQHLTGRRIKICLVTQINGITVSPDIIIIEFTAFNEHEAMASVKTI